MFVDQKAAADRNRSMSRVGAAFILVSVAKHRNTFRRFISELVRVKANLSRKSILISSQEIENFRGNRLTFSSQLTPFPGDFRIGFEYLNRVVRLNHDAGGSRTEIPAIRKKKKK